MPGNPYHDAKGRFASGGGGGGRGGGGRGGRGGAKGSRGGGSGGGSKGSKGGSKSRKGGKKKSQTAWGYTSPFKKAREEQYRKENAFTPAMQQFAESRRGYFS